MLYIKYPISALAIVLSFFVFLYFEHHADVGILGFITFGLMVIYVLVILWYAFLLFRHVRRGAGRTSAALLLAIAIFILPILCTSCVQSPVFNMIDWTRFKIAERQYRQSIELTDTKNAEQRLVFFDWGAGGILTTNFFYALVFDASDEITLPLEQRTQAWKDRAGGKYRLLSETRCTSKVRRIQDHFFVLETVC